MSSLLSDFGVSLPNETAGSGFIYSTRKSANLPRVVKAQKQKNEITKIGIAKQAIVFRRPRKGVFMMS